MRISGACSSKRPGTIATGRLSAPRCGDANGARRPRSSHRRGRPSTAYIGATTVWPARGKPHQQVITAVARELTGFVWAALDAVS